MSTDVSYESVRQYVYYLAGMCCNLPPCNLFERPRCFAPLDPLEPPWLACLPLAPELRVAYVVWGWSSTSCPRPPPPPTQGGRCRCQGL
eukprot:scaffold13792_cov60-Phaeocystis_antarctica.AAC.6